MRRHLVGPLGGVDIDTIDLADSGKRRRIGKHQLAIGVGDIASQRRSTPDGVQSDRHDARQAGGRQHRGEERGVLQQHADVGRFVRVQAGLQRGRHRGTVLEVISPAGERVLEVHTPVVDVDKRAPAGPRPSGDSPLWLIALRASAHRQAGVSANSRPMRSN